MRGCLLVASGSRTFGLRADGLQEIIQVDELLPAPSVHPAVRGVVPVRERLVPLVHLASALGEHDPPPKVAPAAVLATGAGRVIALEVDATFDFVATAPEPVPSAWELSWAGGVLRRDEGLVPIVNLDVLVERLRAAGAGVRP